ncbi:MAG: DUF294 nucleotidyltransferase-like domain-containing protein [Alphaproteobacteria bacterium]
MPPAIGDGVGRLDAFPYCTTAGRVMSAPLVRVPAGSSLGAAAAVMAEAGISSVVVGDPVALGIVTERDLLRATVRDGAAALAAPVDRVMSSPLATVRVDALVATAIGRMERLGIRHLVVVDEGGAAVGMVSARTLLKLRAREALGIGDAIATAADAAAIGKVREGLPGLARALRGDGVTAVAVAGVISAALREATARAGELALAAMAEEGWGPPPAAWCLLVLGSGGRGESLLVPDQDNALIHAGGDAEDGWFAEAGRRIADILDAAGVPYCAGGVMAREPRWRRSREGWRETIGRWIAEKDGGALLDVDIFFDLHPVLGEGGLARDLAADAVAAATRAPLFLRQLASQQETLRPPLGLFGRLRARHGRVDLKKGGTMPLVAAARTMALAVGSRAVATPARLAAVAAAGRITREDESALGAAFETLLGVLVDDQLAQLAAGDRPGTQILLARLDRPRRRALIAALQALTPLDTMVRDALSR